MMRKIVILAAATALIGCANRGIGPQGGPKDSVPPSMTRAVPANGTVHFQAEKVELSFNEYLQLNNVSQNLLVSPPLQHTPDVKVRGKSVLIHFTDTLRDSTTYTLDFGEAICDFTERNPVRGFTYSFSTGPTIDTMEVYGNVYNAENLNPVGGVFVGIHEELDDSAFTKMPFLRIARTDSAGHFCIGNMKPGTYRLYAVDDVGRDYRLTPGEALAFSDSLLSPFVHPHFHTDSLGNDSLVGYEYGPADLCLWLFREQQQRLYMLRTLRDKQHLVQVSFSASPDSLPELRVLRPSEIDSTRSDSAWQNPSPYILTRYSTKRDTVTLWLTDSIAIAQDTLHLEMRYRRTDSLYRLEWTTDTLRAVWHAPRLSAKARKALEKKNRNRRIELKSNARNDFDLYDTLRIYCTTPIASVEADSIHLFEKVDSLFKPVSFTLAPYDTLPMQLSLLAPLKAGKKYELRIDSAALHDVYGISHKPQKFPMQLKTPEDYSTLRVQLQPFVPSARIQVLDTKDQVVRELPAETDGALFKYLKPTTYYLRMYIDLNGDGKWTTGSWEEHRQPEPVYYFPEKIQTKSNWDFVEEWDYLALPQTEAKPKELKKAAANGQK